MTSQYNNRLGCENPEKKTILIADDNESVWDLLYYIVRKEGFCVEKACDGKETLEKARLLHPDLILLDLTSKADCFKTFRELQLDNTGDIPVVLLSVRQIDQTTLEIIKQEPNIKAVIDRLADALELAALLHKILKTRPPDITSRKQIG